MSNEQSSTKDGRLKDFLKYFGPGIAVTIVAFIVAYQFVEPAPPRQITIGSGPKDGVYHRFGVAYAEILAREGITLHVRSTSGSIENLRLLQAPVDGVDVAFVQGGTVDESGDDAITSLGSLYHEPLWVFHRGDAPLDRISDLRGKRIAIGSEGSGTRAAALQLLEDNSMAAPPTVTVSIGSRKAAEALLRGEVDAAIFVISPKSKRVRELLQTEGVHLMSLRRAEAYTRLHHYFSRVRLPEGVLDMKKNVPAQDISLVAPTANLVAKEGFHPALIVLLLQAAFEVHGGGSILHDPGEFPSPKNLCCSLNEEAARFHKKGPPLLQRYLPFWAANLIDRLWVMILPLLTILIPLFKVFPPAYRWRVRSRIYRWYSGLGGVERGLEVDKSAANVAQQLEELDRMEKEVEQIEVPLSYTDELYNLRLHVNLVRNKAREIARASKSDADTAK